MANLVNLVKEVGVGIGVGVEEGGCSESGCIRVAVDRKDDGQATPIRRGRMCALSSSGNMLLKGLMRDGMSDDDTTKSERQGWRKTRMKRYSENGEGNEGRLG